MNSTRARTRRAAAVAAGLATIVGLSNGTDTTLETTGVSGTMQGTTLRYAVEHLESAEREHYKRQRREAVAS